MKRITRNVAYPVTNYGLRHWVHLYAIATLALVAAPAFALVYAAERAAAWGGR